MLYLTLTMLAEQTTIASFLLQPGARALLGALTAFLIVMFAGPSFIAWLLRRQLHQAIRDNGPGSHLRKTGTPTMGGILILLAMVIAVLLWCDLSNDYIWTVVLVTLAYGAIGLVDDYRKTTKRAAGGLPAKWKYFWQSVAAVAVVAYLYLFVIDASGTQLFVPFYRELVILPGFVYILLCYFVLVGSSNAVNLTDGLDGLAILPVSLLVLVFGGLAYFAGHAEFATFLHLPYVSHAAELAVFCGALFGAGLGFLWFNAHPAEVFMGDIGGLALGAALGIIAIILRQELLLFIMGGLFVVETLSVICQVGVYRLTGRRVLRMAPLHHHFELRGWPESRVVVRFWIVSVMLMVVGLAAVVLF